LAERDLRDDQAGHGSPFEVSPFVDRAFGLPQRPQLLQHLADFLLELGDDFAFVGRQRRLRLDDTWFRVDLLFFHRG
jgi:hypothetical protein